MVFQTDKSDLVALVLYKGYNIQNEMKLLKQNCKDLTVWEKLFIMKNEDLVMNFNISSDTNIKGKPGKVK